MLLFFMAKPSSHSCLDNLERESKKYFNGVIIDVKENRKNKSSSEILYLGNGSKYAWEDDRLAQPLFPLLSKGDSVHKKWYTES